MKAINNSEKNKKCFSRHNIRNNIAGLIYISYWWEILTFYSKIKLNTK